VKFVCLADTHNLHHRIEVPDGDVLIHAGDFCGHGRLDEVAAFGAWLETLPHRHKIVVAGNHDRALEDDPEKAEPLLGDVIYLRDTAVEINGLSIYGSPWQPWFYDWAFQRHRGTPMREIWRRIPEDIDVLITHGPMYGIGDQTADGVLAGCEDLREEVLGRVRPRVHVCGHIHEGRGQYRVGETLSINAACVDLYYRPVPEAPISFEFAAIPMDTKVMQ